MATAEGSLEALLRVPTDWVRGNYRVWLSSCFLTKLCRQVVVLWDFSAWAHLKYWHKASMFPPSIVPVAEFHYFFWVAPDLCCRFNSSKYGCPRLFGSVLRVSKKEDGKRWHAGKVQDSFSICVARMQQLSNELFNEAASIGDQILALRQQSKHVLPSFFYHNSLKLSYAKTAKIFRKSQKMSRAIGKCGLPFQNFHETFSKCSSSIHWSCCITFIKLSIDRRKLSQLLALLRVQWSRQDGP